MNINVLYIYIYQMNITYTCVSNIFHMYVIFFYTPDLNSYINYYGLLCAICVYIIVSQILYMC